MKNWIVLGALGLFACGGGETIASTVEAGADTATEAAACSHLKTKCGDDGCCEGLTCIDHYCAPPGEPGTPTPVGDQ